MKLENKTDNSCPYCRAEAKTGMIANSFWICGNATTHENRRSELCREREAHNNTKRERDEAREKAAQWERIALRVDTERAEVREENAKLRYVAERAIDAIPYTEGYGEFAYAASVLREELNQIKDCSNE